MSETAMAYQNQVLRALDDLPAARIEEVLDFIGFLKYKETLKPGRGSAEALLRHAGAWQFEPGELDQLLTEIEQLREIPD